MKTLEQFISSACEGSGVQNDSTDIWVNVDGITCSVRIGDVLAHDEKVPFEASEYLENNSDVVAWLDLYEQYCSEYDKKCSDD